jgi:hypothetical protein
MLAPVLMVGCCGVVSLDGITRSADKQSNADFIQVCCTFRSLP